MNSTKNNGVAFLLKKVGPIFPSFLLTFTYVFFDYHFQAFVFLSPDKAIRPLIGLWLLLLLLILPIHKITRQLHWTGLALYGFVMVFYLSEIYFIFIFYTLILLVIAWGGISYILRKNTINVGRVLFLSAAIPAVFFTISLFQIIPVYFSTDWKAYLNALPDSSKVQIPETLPKKMPDIYYIVLDGYGRSDILQEYYKYDNSEFIKYLKNKGFIVPANVYSNYAKTAASIPSTMNLNYTSDFIYGVEDSLFWWQMNPFLRESYARLFLEEIGYQSISIATDWDITNNPEANIYFKPYPLHFTEFEGNLFEKSRLKTIVAPLLKNIVFTPTFYSHRELILYNFETLASIPEILGPKFIFAHIIAPHPPFVFDKDGNPIAPDYGFTFNDANNFPGTAEEYRTGYVGQLEYVNQKLKEIIEAILSQSEIPPIIILQADHGPGMLTDFTNSEYTCLRERFSIFGAYYLPEAQESLIPDDITPVNLFRIIFNEYFSTDFPLLENKSYYFKDTVYIYRTEDVTMRLNEPDKNISCTQRP